MVAKHPLSTAVDNITERLEQLLETFGLYLDSGLMPFERALTPQEQLARWQSLSPEEILTQIQKSPRDFLDYWKQMERLEARQRTQTYNPLLPYLAPYGLDNA